MIATSHELQLVVYVYKSEPEMYIAIHDWAEQSTHMHTNNGIPL